MFTSNATLRHNHNPATTWHGTLHSATAMQWVDGKQSWRAASFLFSLGCHRGFLIFWVRFAFSLLHLHARCDVTYVALRIAACSV